MFSFGFSRLTPTHKHKTTSFHNTLIIFTLPTKFVLHNRAIKMSHVKKTMGNNLLQHACLRTDEEFFFSILFSHLIVLKSIQIYRAEHRCIRWINVSRKQSFARSFSIFFVPHAPRKCMNFLFLYLPSSLSKLLLSKKAFVYLTDKLFLL